MKNKTSLSSEDHKRMTSVITQKGKKCADCPAGNPEWVSFLIPRVEVDRVLGVFCCSKCAQHHYFELGDKRCKIKNLTIKHEWTKNDIAILEYSGNCFVNSIFEAHLTKPDFDKDFVEIDDNTESDRRARFIKHKYKRRKFQDEAVYHKKMIELLLGFRREESSHSEGDNRVYVSNPRAALSQKRRSMRRLQSAPDSSKRTSELTEDTLRQNTGLRRCRSSPTMKVSSSTHSSHDRRNPQLRQKSIKSQLVQRSMSPNRSPSRKNLGVIDSPATLMRSRRLIAVTNMMNFELPGGFIEMSDDSIMRQAFNQAA